MVDATIHWFDNPIPLNDMTAVWEKLYRENRYLKGLTNEELEIRRADILASTMDLGEDGKYRPRFNQRADRVYAPIRNLDFLRMAAELWFEKRIRGLNRTHSSRYPKQIQWPRRLSDETWCKRPNWVENSRLSMDKYEHPKMLFRFSDAKWNSEFYSKGRIRIAPASQYKDSTLGSARHDDELSLEWRNGAGEIFDVSTDDYYVVCFSSTYDYRLYHDFLDDAECRSCVAIYEPHELTARFLAAIKRHNIEHPNAKIACLRTCPVFYDDPLRMVRPEIVEEIFFGKHFRYAYQTEFRYVLTRPRPTTLTPFFLELGSIADIAEFIHEPKMS
jgi:hypothetical protein